jgi:hypothetical protein
MIDTDLSLGCSIGLGACVYVLCTKGIMPRQNVIGGKGNYWLVSTHVST